MARSNDDDEWVTSMREDEGIEDDISSEDEEHDKAKFQTGPSLPLQSTQLVRRNRSRGLTFAAVHNTSLAAHARINGT